MFLVTAKHNITHCIDGVKSPMPFGTISIWLQDENGNPTNKIPIDIRRLYNSLECLPQKKDTDAIAIPIDPSLQVFSIEKFFSAIPQKFEETVVYGFPENPSDTLNMPDFTSISSLHLKTGTYSFETLHDTITKTTDLTNFYLVSKVADISDSLHGFSGSPVFMKDKATKQWVFIGLQWGHGDFGNNEKFLELVRPDVILKLVQKTINRNP